LARLRRAAWHRGWNFLNDNINFQKPAIASQSRVFCLENTTPGSRRTKRKKHKTKENMNTNYKRVPARFGPETRFDVKPVPPAPFRATQETELERLKNRLLLRSINELAEPRFLAGLRRAANEAAALAWVTPYPLLTFPALFDEKVETALHYAERQTAVRERSAELALVV
jgi:hypothetical protein